MRRTMLLVVCLASRVAFADEPSPDPASSPGFVLLERFDASSRVGIDAGFMHAYDRRLDGVESSRVDLHGHVVGSRNVGGYVQVQAGEYIGDTHPQRMNQGGIGAPELGALFVSHHSSDLAFVYRAGVVLPTSRADYDLADAVSARPNDLTQHLPGLVIVRGSVSALFRNDALFVRIDAGLDRSVYTKGDTINKDFVGATIVRLGSP